MSTQILSRQTATFWRYIVSSIDQMIATLDGLTEEEINWSPLPTTNSLYVLAVHTLGNTAESLLEVLGGQPVNRQREAEFSAKGTSSTHLRQQWQSLRDQIEGQLAQIDEASLEKVFDHPRRGPGNGPCHTRTKAVVSSASCLAKRRFLRLHQPAAIRRPSSNS